MPVNDGHSAGADTVKARLRDAAELGIEELTVYSFSTENWSRPAEEVQGLMEMFSQRIAQRDARAARGGRAHALHRAPRGHLGGASCEQMELGRRADRRRTRGSRCSWPSTTAGARRSSTRRAASAAATEEEFRACLYAPEMHDPDLIIRTSGERRLSNYLLWQSAYSELVFRDELWPDFTREALEQSLAEFSERRRRFGGR